MKDSRYFCTSDLAEHLFLLVIKNLFNNPIEVDSCYFSKYYSTLKWIWTLKRRNFLLLRNIKEQVYVAGLTIPRALFSTLGPSQ